MVVRIDSLLVDSVKLDQQCDYEYALRYRVPKESQQTQTTEFQSNPTKNFWQVIISKLKSIYRAFKDMRSSNPLTASRVHYPIEFKEVIPQKSEVEELWEQVENLREQEEARKASEFVERLGLGYDYQESQFFIP